MGNDNVEVRLKNWFKKFQYLCCGLCVVLGCTFVFEIGYGELPLILQIVGFGLSVMGILLAIHFYEFKIKFGDETVWQSGLVTKEIPYEKVNKLKVANGVIEIRESFFNKISIGNLYTNFDEATDLLAAKVKGKKDINLNGKQKYIDEYLQISSS